MQQVDLKRLQSSLIDQKSCYPNINIAAKHLQIVGNSENIFDHFRTVRPYQSPAVKARQTQRLSSIQVNEWDSSGLRKQPIPKSLRIIQPNSLFLSTLK